MPTPPRRPNDSLLHSGAMAERVSPKLSSVTIGALLSKSVRTDRARTERIRTPARSPQDAAVHVHAAENRLASPCDRVDGIRKTRPISRPAPVTPRPAVCLPIEQPQFYGVLAGSGYEALEASTFIRGGRKVHIVRFSPSLGAPSRTVYQQYLNLFNVSICVDRVSAATPRKQRLPNKTIPMYLIIDYASTSSGRNGLLEG
jgi:hypothetical protein